MEQVRKDWNALNDKRELEIMDKYARMMHTCTVSFIRKTERCLYHVETLQCVQPLSGERFDGLTGRFIVAICIGNFAFDFLEVMPVILDWLVPLNESRPRRTTILVEYFVDPEKYFPLMLIHEYINLLLGTCTIASTGAITMVYVEHVCAMMKIVR